MKFSEAPDLFTIRHDSPFQLAITFQRPSVMGRSQ